MSQSTLPPPTYFQLLFYEYTIERLPAFQAWVSLAISLTSLLICITFLYGSFRIWRRKRALAQTPVVSEPTPYSSPIEEVIDLYQDDKGRKLSNASSAPSLTSSSLTYSPPPQRHSNDVDVCALIAISWAIVSVEQTCELIIFISHQAACPTFVCFDGAPSVTDDCPLMFPSHLVSSFSQPIGMCLFVLATMIRFVRVFSVLSRTRYLALMFGSALAIAATAVRLVALAVHQLMPLWLFRGRLKVVYPPGVSAEDDQEPDFVGPQDTLINTISLVTGWTLSVSVCIYTVCALVAIGLGMQFVSSVRNQVSRSLHHPSEATQEAQDPNVVKEAERRRARDTRFMRTTMALMAAAVGCLGCLFLAMRSDIVQSDQVAVALVNLVFRMIMALISLAMVGVNEMVVRGSRSDYQPPA